MAEALVQSQRRLRAPSLRETLWRNNVGALPDRRGRLVRYGLANESTAMNRQWASADLIGWRQLVITPEMVGMTIAQFASIETKRDRTVKPTAAQERWFNLVAEAGGYAEICYE